MAKWQKIDQDLKRTAGRPASDEQMHRAFLEANGLMQWAFVSGRMDNIPHVLARGAFPNGRRAYQPDGYPPPPHLDHGRFYRGLGLAVLVYHPYAYPDVIRAEVEAWAMEHGLVAKVYDSAKSWYYPGQTALVIVTAPGTEVVA